MGRREAGISDTVAARRGTGVGSTVGVPVQVLEVPVGASARVLAGVVVVGLVDLGSDGAVLLQVRVVLVSGNFGFYGGNFGFGPFGGGGANFNGGFGFGGGRNPTGQTGGHGVGGMNNGNNNPGNRAGGNRS